MSVLPKCRTCGHRHRTGPCLLYCEQCRGPSSEENAPKKPDKGKAGQQKARPIEKAPPDITPEDATRILSESEQLERLREASRERKRRWYERLKSDPVRYAEYLERERERKRK